MLEGLYGRLHDAVTTRPRLSLLLATLAGPLLGLGLLGVRLDMSFRPLFADAGVDTEATAEFERVFGQSSGAFIGAILQRPTPDLLTPESLARLSVLSGRVERIEHVTEVVSLARLAVPVPGESGPRGAWLASPDALERREAGAAARLRAVLASDPRLREGLLSGDGTRTLLLARLDLPLDDLASRERAIRRFRETVGAAIDPETSARFVGVSVVETAYARIVLLSLARSFALTVLALVLVLALLFRSPTPVVVTMAGVTLATPASLGLMTLLGQDLTMLNSVVPLMILVIGVADAIHMEQSFADRVRRGRRKLDAIREMYEEMALPCLLTTATTSLGFLSLTVARITAIRDFGLNVAIGIWVVYLCNLVVVPALLTLLPLDAVRVGRRRGQVGVWMEHLAGFTARRRGAVVAFFAVAVLVGGAGIPRLESSQRFNAEVRADHPVRADQALLEREFTGFLGPEISIAAADGRSITEATSLRRIAAFQEAVAALPDVQRVEGPLDALPSGLVGDSARTALLRLRVDPLLGPRTREVIDPSGSRAALLVRTGDLGTDRAVRLVEDVEGLSAVHLEPSLRAEVVGQWWLAQQGMRNIIRDMAATFLTSCLLVLAVVLIVLRDRRLFLVSVLPNVLPMFFALAFMAWAGISLRIGTAMVLAIALGIAVDDTIHVLVRLRREAARTRSADTAVRETLRGVGGALLYTTLVLGVGFLSMLWNDLLAIRDMGLVGAFALGVALLADVLLLPALYVLTSRSPLPDYVTSVLALRPDA